MRYNRGILATPNINIAREHTAEGKLKRANAGNVVTKFTDKYAGTSGAVITQDKHI